MRRAFVVPTLAMGIADMVDAIAARDASIVRQIRAGFPCSHVARAFGLTTARVYQIVAKDRRNRFPFNTKLDIRSADLLAATLASGRDDAFKSTARTLGLNIFEANEFRKMHADLNHGAATVQRRGGV